jgi:Flp pilus assembly protein TadG
MIGFMGMTADVGNLELTKRRMQTAADAAAVAGVWAKTTGKSYVDAGRTDSGLNGFIDGVGGASVTMNNPPQSGNKAGDANFVEAVVSKNVPTYFMGMFNVTSTALTVRAVAGAGPSLSCVYVLDRTAADAAKIGGSGDWRVGCGVVVNSSNSNALDVGSGAYLRATSTRVVGGIDGASRVIPAATATAAVTDPLAHIAEPVVSGAHYTKMRVAGTVTLSPGIYDGGLDIDTDAIVTFQAGTYVTNGGKGLNVGAHAVLRNSGDGVLFYITGNRPLPAGVSGVDTRPAGVVIGCNTDNRLNAKTTGPQAGILFFQDRSLSSYTTVVHDMAQANAYKVFNGVLYFRDQVLKWDDGGGGVNAKYTPIVVRLLEVVAPTTNPADFSDLFQGSPLRGRPALFE